MVRLRSARATHLNRSFELRHSKYEVERNQRRADCVIGSWIMAGVLVSAIVTPRFPKSISTYSRSRCRAENGSSSYEKEDDIGKRKKVVVIGSGWGALASAHHLAKQSLDVTVLGVGNPLDEEEVGVGGNGFRYSYRNIYSLIDELGIEPFTRWTKSAQYSPKGMEVEFPIFHEVPKLPTPLGVFLYPQFYDIPLVDRLTAVPLMLAAIDFDNTDTAWRKYDAMTARELFKKFGCSEKLFQEVFNPILQVGLLTPAEQCSAAATLGMLNYFVLAHQQNFDVRWCRGTIRDMIFNPWKEFLGNKSCRFVEDKEMVQFLYKDTEYISGVVYGEEVYECDAIVLAVGVSTLQSIVLKSSILKTKQEFLNTLNLSAISMLSVKLWMDKKVDIPKPGNICYCFDDLTAWTFFDLNSIYDECVDEPFTVIKAEFYHVNHLLPQKDEQIVAKVLSYLSRCIEGFEECTVLRQVVSRYPNHAAHFFPGSYKHMMRGSTTVSNLFMAGDWIVNRHGSWSQEKAYVTGLEAANLVVDYLEIGEFAKIIPVEEDESHVEILRNLNRSFNEIRAQSPLSEFFLQ